MTGDGGNDHDGVKLVVDAGGMGIAHHASNKDLLNAANGHIPKGSTLASMIELQWRGQAQSRIQRDRREVTFP